MMRLPALNALLMRKSAASCPYCKSPLDTGADTTILCGKCRTPHHGECWGADKKCSVFGCNGTNILSPIPQQLAPTWLPKLRVVVLTYFPVVLVLNSIHQRLSLEFLQIEKVLLAAWFVLAIGGLPVLILSELHLFIKVTIRRGGGGYAAERRRNIISLLALLATLLVVGAGL